MKSRKKNNMYLIIEYQYPEMTLAMKNNNSNSIRDTFFYLLYNFHLLDFSKNLFANFILAQTKNCF